MLAEGAKTTAYTYIGEKITWDIYWHGTIGAAKQDLIAAVGIDKLAARGDARVGVESGGDAGLCGDTRDANLLAICSR